MARLFRDRTIEKRVMTVVRDAIDKAQLEHDDDIERAEQALQETLSRVHADHADHLDAIVEAGVKKVFASLH